MALDDASTRSEEPKLLQPVPANRSYDNLRRHFDCERAIARRLRAASRSERKEIFRTMYDELFATVPDHPRLARRSDEALTARVNRSKTALLRPFMHSDAVFLEFGSGDCRFSFEMAKRFRQVHAVDIAVGHDIPSCRDLSPLPATAKAVPEGLGPGAAQP
jgi:hypothetical protein